MKLPVTIIIKYTAESDLPIMTVDSTHVIANEDDVNIIASYVNVFSSITFTDEDIVSVIEQCQEKHVFNVKNDLECLSFSLV